MVTRSQRPNMRRAVFTTVPWLKVPEEGAEGSGDSIPDNAIVDDDGAILTDDDGAILVDGDG